MQAQLNFSAKVAFRALLAFALVVAFLPTAAIPQARAAGTDIASGMSGTCVWVIDADGKLTVSPAAGDEGMLDKWSGTDGAPWYEHRDKITSAGFQGTVIAKTCEFMFYECANLSNVDLAGLDTIDVYSMNGMFSGCSSLENIDLSVLDLPAAKYMSSLFWDCTSLQRVDLSRVKAPEIVSISSMFSGCTSLKEVDLSGFAGGRAFEFNGIAGLFSGCESIEEVDLSALNPTGPMSLHAMFKGCGNLKRVEFPERITIAGTMESAFSGCSSLTELDLSSSSSSGTSLTMYQTFKDCAALKTLKLGNWAIGNMYYTFSGCSGLEELDLSSFDTSALKNTYHAFYNCKALKKVTVSDAWDTSSVTSSEDMFYRCKEIVGANGTGFSAMHVDASYARIDTPDAPGYFWPASDDEGGEDTGGQGGTGDPSGQGGSEQTTPSTSPATDPAPSATPATNPSSTDATTPTANIPKATTLSKQPLASSGIKLSKASFAYTGKRIKPKTAVTYNGTVLRAGIDYTLSYPKNCKRIGSYKLTIQGKGPYAGTATATFKVVPKASKLSSLKAHKNSNGSSGFIAKWKRIGKLSCGYELRWSASKSFKKAASVTFAASSAFAKKGSAALRVNKKSWHGKRIYVQIRAFAKAKGKAYTSAWSSPKAVKLKK